MFASVDVARSLFKARKTLIEMFQYRGYEDTPEQLNEEAYTKLWSTQTLIHVKNALSFTVSKKGNEIDIIHVRFLHIPDNSSQTSIDKNTIEVNVKMILTNVSSNIQTIYFVSPLSLTTMASKRMNEVEVAYGKVKIRMIDELLVQNNITKNGLVPKQYILSKKERARLREELKQSEDDEKWFALPEIKTSDPMMIFIGAHAGDIICSERKSRSGREGEIEKYYRRVVASLS